jgi:hypothetical protein
MTDNKLYETIFKRQSIRKYSQTLLTEEVLSKLSNFIKELKPLYPAIITEIHIVTQKDVKGLLQVNAPHYIAAFSETKNGYLLNMGFMLQQIDLYLSANGLGCCWQGWPKPTKELRINRDLEFITVLAFGSSQNNIHRNSETEFKRKPIENIRNLPAFDQFIEPARLAPFGTSQSYFFNIVDDVIHVYCAKSGIIKIEKMERMNQINVGIAISHLYVSADHFNKVFDFSLSRNAPEINGYFYMGTIKLS